MDSDISSGIFIISGISLNQAFHSLNDPPQLSVPHHLLHKSYDFCLSSCLYMFLPILFWHVPVDIKN